MSYQVRVAEPGAGHIAFDSLVELAAFPSAVLVAGLLVYVVAPAGTWLYAPTSTATPDGISILAASGGGNWLLTNTGGDPIVASKMVADAVVLQDAVMNIGFPDVTSAAAPFTAALVGKPFHVVGAGADGLTNVLHSTVATFVSASHITLAANAAGSVVAAKAAGGTDNGPLLQPYLTASAASGVEVQQQAGRYYFATGVTMTANSRWRWGPLVENITGLLGTGAFSTGNCFVSTAATTGANNNLTSNATIGDTSVLVTSSIPAGTRVGLTDGHFHGSQYVTGTPSGGGPFTIPLDRPLCFNYPSASSALVPLTNVPNEVHVYCDGGLITGPGRRYFFMGNCLNSSVEGARYDASAGYLSGGEFLGTWDTYCVDCTFSDWSCTGQPLGPAIESGERCYLRRNVFAQPPVAGAIGYQILDSADCHALDCSSTGCSGALGFGGYIGADANTIGCFGCSVQRGEYNGNTTGVFQEDGDGNRIVGVDVIGLEASAASTGIDSGDGGLVVDGCDVKGCTVGVFARSVATGITRILNTHVGNAPANATAFSVITGSTAYLYGCLVDSTVAIGLHVDGTSFANLWGYTGLTPATKPLDVLVGGTLTLGDGGVALMREVSGFGVGNYYSSAAGASPLGLSAAAGTLYLVARRISYAAGALEYLLAVQDAGAVHYYFQSVTAADPNETWNFNDQGGANTLLSVPLGQSFGDVRLYDVACGVPSAGEIDGAPLTAGSTALLNESAATSQLFVGNWPGNGNSPSFAIVGFATKTTTDTRAQRLVVWDLIKRLGPEAGLLAIGGVSRCYLARDAGATWSDAMGVGPPLNITGAPVRTTRVWSLGRYGA